MRRDKGKLPPFVPVLKDTMKTAAWKALSHGARSLYVTLKGRYNNKVQNAVYVSTRDAEEELGRYSSRPNVMRWFRELQHYGFIVEISPAHHGVNGHGRAPHYRLTEAWHLGKVPTRDFLSWDGIPFTEKRKRKATSFGAKNRIRGDHGDSTLVTTGTPLVPEIVSAAAESGDHGDSMSHNKGGDHGDSITSLTTPYADPNNLLSAFEATWTSPITVPLRWLPLQRLFQRPAKRPDKRAEAAYLAALYQTEIPDTSNIPPGILSSPKRPMAKKSKRERLDDEQPVEGCRSPHASWSKEL
jgi:hypothetical protein